MATVTSTAFIVPAVQTTYAGKINQKFTNANSNIIDLVQRINDTVAKLDPASQRNWSSKLAKALGDFRKRYPRVKTFNRSIFHLCSAIDKRLCEIRIDTTMQRELDLNWILNIISGFRAFQAQPIQVYQAGDYYNSWDGQHTAVALYLIAVHGMGMNYNDVYVPVNIYSINSRGEIRRVFIANNSMSGKGAGKKPLDIIDIFEQQVYAVELDGETDPDWVMSHEKWKHICTAGMFLSATKRNDTNWTGAISRLNEINDSSVEVVRQFCVYGKYVINNSMLPNGMQRPINSKELPIIIEFLNLCEQNQIKYSDKEIESLAQHCIDLFDANFDSGGPFWAQVHQANLNAYDKLYKGLPVTSRPDQPRNTKNLANGIAFFWHQLIKSWVPSMGKNFIFPKAPFSIYTPNKADLF